MTEHRTAYTVHPFGWSPDMDLDAPDPIPLGEGVNSQMVNLATVFMHDADAYLVGDNPVAALWSLGMAQHFVNLVAHRVQGALKSSAKDD